MSIFKDKTLKSVAEAAAKIMAQESSHGTHPKTEKEKSLAALAHPKDKITHKDVLVGRGVLKKEEVEQIDELSKDTLKSYVKKASDGGKTEFFRKHAIAKAKQKIAMKEEVELEEAAKWRSSSAAEPNPKHQSDVASFDRSATGGALRSKADTPTSQGSLLNRKKSQVATQGPRAGMITKKSAESLKNRIRMNKEEVELEEGDPAHWKGKSTVSRRPAPPGTYAHDVAMGKYKKVKSQPKKVVGDYQKEEVELEEELTAWQKIQRKKEEMEDKRRERMEREDMPAPEKKKPTTQKVAGHRYGGSKQKDETNEETLPFTQMLESYTERGLKALSGMIHEEPDNEQWTKELKDQEATAAGKKKSASVAAPSTMGVKTMKEDEELTLEDFTPEEIEEFMQSEEYEQLDELSKSTLGSYIRKAASSARNRAYVAGSIGGGTGPRPNQDSVQQLKISDKRVEGIRRASRKMEEDVEVIDFTDVYNVQKYTIKDEDIQQERALTEPEKKKKEDIVMGMKKGLEGFKQRYGERAKQVMYATATKQAKED